MAIQIRGMTPLLAVFDMATSLRFYCDVLGFQIAQTDSGAGDKNHADDGTSQTGHAANDQHA